MARVAIVEDDERLLELYSAVLESDGHRVTTYPDADTFPHKVAGQMFDVLLLDLQLPGEKHGVTLIRDLGTSLKIIGLTGADRTVRAQAVLLSGTLFTLQKPIGIQALRKAVELALVL